MIHLHVHDALGSLLDSTNRPEELAKRAKELGMSAIAITNHGMMTSSIKFYQACLEEGIKPIMGCEVYVTDDVKVKDSTSRYDHLILLAKNKIGYRNLLKIVSLGFSEGFYYKPRVDWEILEQYKEGLVVSSACLGATIPKMILKDYPDEQIIEAIYKFKNTFEDYFLEVQGATSQEQKKVNQKLAELSPVVGVPLVATTDVHFLREDDHELHGVFIQISQDRSNEVYKDCWLKSEDEVFDILDDHIGFANALEAVANTQKIADMCNVEIEMGKAYLPHFPIPAPFADEGAYLRHKVQEGFKKRKIDLKPFDDQLVYLARVEEELDVMIPKGFAGYHLIVADFLEECRNRDIYLGDGRGSADNSLVCYLLEITNVDPIVYDLNFSRYLTLERVELPDIDMDIQSSRKSDAVNILREKYGFDNVAQICTFGTLKAKAIIDAVGKVFGLSYKETTEIKKYVPDDVGLELPKGVTLLEYALEKNATLRVYQEKYPKLFEYALRLENLPRTISVHAGGVVICPSDRDMSEFTALALSSDGDIITQLDMKDVEKVGLVKMDALGINTLDIVSDAMDAIWEDCHCCYPQQEKELAEKHEQEMLDRFPELHAIYHEQEMEEELPWL
ncbi:DNA polymerase III subunit alpha [Paenibacillus sp. MMO-177]|uniref:DNA polymerase III subunit alpha n=1 Tax=Paenibacillus sp. MMO-177 TaxID=3081289 RepID=UPI003018CDDC